MSQTRLTIHPMDLGTLVGIDKSIFTIRHNQGIEMDVPCLSYLVLGGEKIILVDTGPCSPEWAASYHRPLRKEPFQEVPNALGKFDVSPEDIDLVVLTHLHWDHCFNLEYFTKAVFAVQKKELQYAVAPLAADGVPYEAFVPGIRPPWMEVYDRMMVLDGDTELIPGLKTIHLPGHTPGFQGAVVETQTGPWIIAGDTVPLYENWEKSPGTPKGLGGIYQNLFDYCDTLKKIEVFGDNILPGHDERVLEHDQYPIP